MSPFEDVFMHTVKIRVIPAGFSVIYVMYLPIFVRITLLKLGDMTQTVTIQPQQSTTKKKHLGT